MTTSTNKEALLILYLADELSAQERADVERMLASDVPMRQMLEELRGAQATIAAALARLDEAQPMPQAEVAAVSRRTGRAMKQWQTQQIAKQAAPMTGSNPRRGLAGWRGYALAAAVAILFIGLSVYWGQQGVTSTPPAPGAGDDPQLVITPDDWRNIEAPVDPSNPADREAAELAAAFDPRPVQHDSISNLEQEMSKLNELAAGGRADAGTQ
jgi:anti-sigma factor RsiW